MGQQQSNQEGRSQASYYYDRTTNTVRVQHQSSNNRNSSNHQNYRNNGRSRTSNFSASLNSNLRQLQQQQNQPNYLYYYDRNTNTIRRTILHTVNQNQTNQSNFRTNRFGRSSRYRNNNNNNNTSNYRNSEEIRNIIQRQQQRQIQRQIQNNLNSYHQPTNQLGRRRRGNSPTLNLDDILSNNNNNNNSYQLQQQLQQQNYQQQQQQQSNAQIEQLLFSLPSADSFERQKQGSCSICLIELSDQIEEGDRAVVIPCYHVFHKNCIQQWMEAQGEAADCPLCGTLINQDEGRMMLQLAEG